jgi:hypothetical protein
MRESCPISSCRKPGYSAVWTFRPNVRPLLGEILGLKTGMGTPIFSYACAQRPVFCDERTPAFGEKYRGGQTDLW